MSEDEYKKIFSKNLRHYMEINGINQMDIMDKFGFSSSTVSSWCTGAKLPRMGKIQALADYFKVNKSDLIEEHPFAADLPDVVTFDDDKILTDGLTNEQKEEVKRYVEWIKDRDNKE